MQHKVFCYKADFSGQLAGYSLAYLIYFIERQTLNLKQKKHRRLVFDNGNLKFKFPRTEIIAN